MHYRNIVWLTLILVAACSNTPTKDAASTNAEAAPVAQRSAGAATTPANTSSVTGVPDPRKDPANILSRRSVYFNYDESLIQVSDEPLLQAHANYLRQHPNARVTAQGNADERGSREYNIALGQRRADTIKQYLKLLGVADGQIETVSFGKEKPVCTISEESCWWQNRRVVLVYSGE